MFTLPMRSSDTLPFESTWTVWSRFASWAKRTAIESPGRNRAGSGSRVALISAVTSGIGRPALAQADARARARVQARSEARRRERIDRSVDIGARSSGREPPLIVSPQNPSSLSGEPGTFGSVPRPPEGAGNPRTLHSGSTAHQPRALAANDPES